MDGANDEPSLRKGQTYTFRGIKSLNYVNNDTMPQSIYLMRF